MRVIITIILGLLAIEYAGAQEVVKGNTNTWFLLYSRLTFNQKLSLTNELHERTGKILSDQGQILIRPSIDYHFNKNVEFSLGYTFIRAEPYYPYSIPITRNEHNVWEQILIKTMLEKVQFQNRFRQENRWIDHIETSAENDSEIKGSDYRNRFRYRFTLSFDIYEFENKKTIFAAAFDEIWIDQNDRLMFTQLARNWVYLGLGYKFNSNTNLQLAYVHQSDKIGSDTFINSPIIQLSFFTTFVLK